MGCKIFQKGLIFFLSFIFIQEKISTFASAFQINSAKFTAIRSLPNPKRKRVYNIVSNAALGNKNLRFSIQGQRPRLSVLNSLNENLNSHDPRKKETVAKLYRIATLFYLITFLSLFLSENRIQTMSLSSKVGGAAGYGIAAGVCNILHSATVNGRLQSDTYKRMNIGLLIFSTIGLFAFPGEASFHPSLIGALRLSATMTLSKLVGTVVAYQGWIAGTFGKSMEYSSMDFLKKIKFQCNELFSGMKQTCKGLKLKNKSATLYRNQLFVLIFFGITNQSFSILNSFEHGKSAFQISLHISAIARLGFISTLVYCLKDAAERDRLRGKSFIQLNVLLATWAILVGISDGIYKSGYTIRKSLDMFIFASPFVFKAYLSTKKTDTDSS